MKKVLVPIANGIEELEAICIIDILRRAGATVTVASVEQLQVTASRGVKIVADQLIANCIESKYDLIALPGGMPGAEKLRDSELLIEMLKSQKESGRYYAAICASPAVVFNTHDLLKGKFATCYPAFREQLPNREKEEKRVVIDENCITSVGPGSAIEFSVKLVELLYGKEKAGEIANSMLVVQ